MTLRFTSKNFAGVKGARGTEALYLSNKQQHEDQKLSAMVTESSMTNTNLILSSSKKKIKKGFFSSAKEDKLGDNAMKSLAEQIVLS